jgi:outer membrane protein OmpA-like peptidoglycan-associated protein
VRVATRSALLLFTCAALCVAGCATPTVEDEFVRELEGQGLLAEKTDRGLVLYLPDVLFDFDDAELIVRLAPERTVSIEGHSDAIGTESYNRELSLRRARSVERELVDGGVSPDKIVMIGYGERFPVAPNQNPDGSDNPEGRSQNRRVEVVIERTS